MKHCFKLFVSLLLALVILFNTVACGANSNNSGNTDDGQGGEVTNQPTDTPGDENQSGGNIGNMTWG